MDYAGNRLRVKRHSYTNSSRILPSDHKQGRKRQGNKAQRCICPPSDHQSIEFPAIWSEFRANRQFCDGIIRCSGNEIFPIHRVILSAVSPYFRALFTNSLQATKINHESEVSLDTISGDVFSIILDYAYTGNCKVTVNNVEQLLPLADQLEVLGVVQLCCKLLLQELKPDNCLGIHQFAKHYFCHDVEEKSRKYIRHQFNKILQESSEFCELTHEDLRSVLCDDELNVKSEETVFEALKRWIEENEDERKQYLPVLLECVRLGLMSIQYISSNILDWKLIRESKVILRMRK